MRLYFHGKRNQEEILSDVSCSNELNVNLSTNIIIKGDNFDVMRSLLRTHKGCIDLIYIDPPFGTNRVFSWRKDRANAISSAKDSVIAYSDFMDTDEFLNFMYERFVLMRELLSEKGSIYVHIDVKMGHYFKAILDEVFGMENFKNDITRIKCNPKNFYRKAYGNEKDVILFYAKNAEKNIWNDIKKKMDEQELLSKFPKIDQEGRRYNTIPLHAPGETLNGNTAIAWREMLPPAGRHWRTSPEEFDRMDAAGLIEWSKNGNPRIKKYADDHKGKKIQDIWEFKDPQNPIYPTQKNLDMLKLIVEQSSSENSIILDCFAGSGTTLVAAEALNRKFIGIDSSSIAIEVMQKRLKGKNVLFY